MLMWKDGLLIGGNESGRQHRVAKSMFYAAGRVDSDAECHAFEGMILGAYDHKGMLTVVLQRRPGVWDEPSDSEIVEAIRDAWEHYDSIGDEPGIFIDGHQVNGEPYHVDTAKRIVKKYVDDKFAIREVSERKT